MDGLDKDGIRNDNSLLFPSLSTISCKINKVGCDNQILLSRFCSPQKFLFVCNMDFVGINITLNYQQTYLF